MFRVPQLSEKWGWEAETFVLLSHLHVISKYIKSFFLCSKFFGILGGGFFYAHPVFFTASVRKKTTLFRE
jgi:hypothetical protein